MPGDSGTTPGDAPVTRAVWRGVSGDSGGKPLLLAAPAAADGAGVAAGGRGEAGGSSSAPGGSCSGGGTLLSADWLLLLGGVANTSGVPVGVAAAVPPAGRTGELAVDPAALAGRGGC
jgi:hypothetical protein